MSSTMIAGMSKHMFSMYIVHSTTLSLYLVQFSAVAAYFQDGQQTNVDSRWSSEVILLDRHSPSHSLSC